ncbi:unnamed protein product [Cuscuta epithymum]|uniref:F-box associated beta-propeller type 1 domain-containing protein n=1 Tax=Cuscuta epithymum TaxID=186058 RepID=A0AAV0DPB9_9ASTE|nr:unnamed protein product [Cuscuta epithymum]
MLLQDPSNQKWNCIYNLFTRDYKLVPKLDSQHCWYCSYGVGCHPVTYDYKTFRILITSDRDDSRSKAYVYSLSRNEWIPLGELPYKIDRFCIQGVLVHGRLHWLTVQNKGMSNDQILFLI